MLDLDLLAQVLKQLDEIEAKAKSAVYKDDLDDLIDDAELKGCLQRTFALR